MKPPLAGLSGDFASSGQRASPLESQTIFVHVGSECGKTFPNSQLLLMDNYYPQVVTIVNGDSTLFSLLLTRGTNAEDVEAVCLDRKSGLPGHGFNDCLESIQLGIHDGAALGADQMWVRVGSAAIKSAAVVAESKLKYLTDFLEQSDGLVDGRQARGREGPKYFIRSEERRVGKEC